MPLSPLRTRRAQPRTNSLKVSAVISGLRRRAVLSDTEESWVSLLDEPAAHLDPASARRLWETVETLAAGRTLILVSHGRGWEGLASRVIGLDHGQLRPPAAAVRPSPTTAILRPLPTEVAR